MGILIAAAGTLIAIPLVMFLLLFTGNIIFTDSLIISIIGAVLLHTRTGMHPVFCILAGAAILAGTALLYLREKMFWVFTIASTAVWGYLAGFFTNDISGDRTWTVFLGAVMAVWVLILHIAARNKLTGS